MASNLMNNISQDCVNDDAYANSFSTVKFRFSASVTILIYSIYLLPFCFGVFGNISVCLIFFQQKKLRSITNTFLMNLCLNDLIVLCVSIPMTLSSALLEHWVFGKFLCKLLNFTPTLTALVSTFTVAVIAVERWFFIVNKRKFDRRCTIIILMLLWIVSILIALPEFISRTFVEVDRPEPYPPSSPNIQINSSLNRTNMNNNHTHLATAHMDKPSCYMTKVSFCVLHPSLPSRIFSYIVITVQYLVPFLFVSVSCYLISRFLKQRMKQMRVYQTHRSPSTPTPITITIDKGQNTVESQQLDDFTEHESTSYDDLPVPIVSNENKSTQLLTRFRNAFQNHGNSHDTIVLNAQNCRTSSIVDTILIPTVKIQSHSERRFHRSKKLLICVAALFTISWLPLTVVQIYLEHNQQITDDETNFVYGFLLIPSYLISSISAWMNPVIYNYINRSFRREFYALYPCCCQLPSASAAASASAISSRADLPSVIVNRCERQQLKDVEAEETSVVSPARTNKSGARFVTFADGEKKRKASLMMVNEHI